jgi:hypothetical protein
VTLVAVSTSVVSSTDCTVCAYVSTNTSTRSMRHRSSVSVVAWNSMSDALLVIEDYFTQVFEAAEHIE